MVCKKRDGRKKRPRAFSFTLLAFVYSETTLICKLVTVHFPGPMNMNKTTRTKDIVITILHVKNSYSQIPSGI